MIREAREEADIEITPSDLRVVRVNTQKVFQSSDGLPCRRAHSQLHLLERLHNDYNDFGQSEHAQPLVMIRSRLP